uniref:Uncharacterized protein n=1 Tax=Rhabditophanes sp. KR3021 TaxID=114890 RepID=A0AC35TY32_9BILA
MVALTFWEQIDNLSHLHSGAMYRSLTCNQETFLNDTLAKIETQHQEVECVAIDQSPAPPASPLEPPPLDTAIQSSSSKKRTHGAAALTKRVFPQPEKNITNLIETQHQEVECVAIDQSPVPPASPPESPPLNTAIQSSSLKKRTHGAAALTKRVFPQPEKKYY